MTVYQEWEWREGMNPYSLLSPLFHLLSPRKCTGPKAGRTWVWTVRWVEEGGVGERPISYNNACSIMRVRTFTVFVLTLPLWTRFYLSFCSKLSLASHDHISYPAPSYSTSPLVKLREPALGIPMFHDYGAGLLHAPLISQTSLRRGLRSKCFQF